MKLAILYIEEDLTFSLVIVIVIVTTNLILDKAVVDA
jgi:hypothetical protein